MLGRALALGTWDSIVVWTWVCPQQASPGAGFLGELWEGGMEDLMLGACGMPFGDSQDFCEKEGVWQASVCLREQVGTTPWEI